MSTKLIKSKQKLSPRQLKITFQGEEMDPSFLNTLRRILISEVPSYSLKGQLKILRNSSVYNNEYLFNRFQLLPLYVTKPLPEGLIFRICDPDDSNQPLKNMQNVDLLVGAHDLQIFQLTSGNRAKLDIRELILYNAPLLKLRKGEEFHLEVQPVLGRGFQHATFKACNVRYKWENQVSLGQVKNRPSNPITGQLVETIEDKRDYPQDKWENPDLISLVLEENGHYPPEICFQLALETLDEKLRIFKNYVIQKETARVEVIEQKGIPNYVQLKIIDPEDLEEHPMATHTLGNLLAEHLYYHLHRKIKGDLPKLLQSNTSYRIPHPLDTVMYLYIKTPADLYTKLEQRLPALQLLIDTIDDLLKLVQRLRQEFGK